MSRDFTYAGHRVHLRLEATERYWIAEVPDADMMHVLDARPVDDVERIVPLVEDWIDRGMPGGGASG